MTPAEVQQRLDEYGVAAGWASTQPVIVTCRLAGPAVLRGYTTLDGLLARCVWEEALGQEAANVPDDKGHLYEIPLPLARRGSVWAASAAIYHSPGERVQYWRKRWCDDPAFEEWVKLPGRLVTTNAQFKEYNQPMPVVNPGRITWYACGDPAAILRLLEDYIHYIGKKPSQGYGRVLEWAVQLAADDWSVWRLGQVMRPIPLPEAGSGEHRRALTAYAPPYWHPARLAMCAVPW